MVNLFDIRQSFAADDSEVMRGNTMSNSTAKAPCLGEDTSAGRWQTVQLADLNDGDLLFVADPSGMGQAVQKSTGQFSHVVIYFKGYVYHAASRRGVVKDRIKDFLAEFAGITEAAEIFGADGKTGTAGITGVTGATRFFECSGIPDQVDSNQVGGVDHFQAEHRLCAVYRYPQIDAVSVRRQAENLLGQPYNRTFLPDGQGLYCSQFIATILPIFDMIPMRFDDGSGKDSASVSAYWQDYFADLGISVPVGQPGTNPNQIAASPQLVFVGWLL
ncbi:Orthopoxvirus protein of uncharacterised function (DUF830) [Scardovia inopinata]|uniref:Uncharacterized protein n=2 Tax=Scardovia inopinata TaxID=78259 RepID=W5IHS7_SCAIO|nr:hypothetical protein HMPREF9020_00193 [Scardovia inopinata F0304]SUV51690.1 Orthopoxvirus protein of uncharacterised function (DUF830) [Scardovia inopinata]